MVLGDKDDLCTMQGGGGGGKNVCACVERSDGGGHTRLGLARKC